MKERPIIFGGPMVRAILEGRKTQTRRIVKGRGIWSVEDAGDCSDRKWPGYEDKYGIWCDMPCPHGYIGDRLWVRENAYYRLRDDRVFYEDGTGKTKDGWLIGAGQISKSHGWKKRPSIHMPRWASRITLEITDIRVERLQDISEADAKAEGVTESIVLPGDRGSFVASFGYLWESIHGAGSWAANPWVWVIEFQRFGGEG